MSGPAGGREGTELLHGLRLIADLSGAGNVTREAIVTSADPNTGKPTGLFVGNPDPVGLIPTVDADGDAAQAVLMTHGLVLSPGSAVVEDGNLTRPTVTRGASTLVRVWDDIPSDAEPSARQRPGHAPLNHILRIVRRRLAFLADDDREPGGGGHLAWAAETRGRYSLTRIADFWAPMTGARPGGLPVTGMRVDALIGDAGGRGWPLALRPASNAEDLNASRNSRGWFAVGPGGEWCPEVPVPDAIPGKDGNDGKPGPQGPAGPNPPPPPPPPPQPPPPQPPLPPKNGTKGHELTGDPWLDPFLEPFFPEDGELTPCNVPEPPTATPPTPDEKPKIGSYKARLHPLAGKSAIAPTFKATFNPDGDQRQLLGGGKYAPGAPNVPRAGIRGFDRFDFAAGIHTTWDVHNAIIDKANQIIAFLNERLPGAPNVITHGGLHLPAQKAEEVRLEQFALGSIVNVKRDFRSSKEMFRLPHIVTQDKAGRRLLDRISSDRAPERTLGTGEKGVDIFTRYATGESAHRDKGKVYDLQPKTGYESKSKRLVATGAEYQVDALVVLAEDGSETKVETTATTGATTIKSTPVGGTEVARTLAARDGTIPLAPSTLTTAQLVKADANGDLVTAGDAAAVRTLIGAISFAGIKFSNGNLNRTVDTAAYTLDTFADQLYTLCYDMSVYGYANGWSFAGSKSYAYDCTSFAANTLYQMFAAVAYELNGAGSYTIPSTYGIDAKRHTYQIDCDSYTLNQLCYVATALFTFLGV